MMHAIVCFCAFSRQEGHDWVFQTESSCLNKFRWVWRKDNRSLESRCITFLGETQTVVCTWLWEIYLYNCNLSALISESQAGHYWDYSNSRYLQTNLRLIVANMFTLSERENKQLVVQVLFSKSVDNHAIKLHYPLSLTQNTVHNYTLCFISAM